MTLRNCFLIHLVDLVHELQIYSKYYKSFLEIEKEKKKNLREFCETKKREFLRVYHGKMYYMLIGETGASYVD